jgi:hypothetical protein
MALELKTHFVAFVDLLGFSEMVRSDCESTEPPKYLELLHQAHLRAIALLANDVEAGLIQFSDSVVLSRPFDLAALSGFLKALAHWQKSLLGDGLRCRGAVTFGKHFVNDRFLFSTGLIDAYGIEVSQARYPRIVVSENLLDLATPDVDWAQVAVLREDDGIAFVDYLTFEDNAEKARLANAVAGVLARAPATASVQEKARWLAHYADHKLGTQFVGPRFSGI